MATPMTLLTISANNRLAQDMLFPLHLEIPFYHFDNLSLNEGSNNHVSRQNDNRLYSEIKNHNG